MKMIEDDNADDDDLSDVDDMSVDNLSDADRVIND